MRWEFTHRRSHIWLCFLEKVNLICNQFLEVFVACLSRCTCACDALVAEIPFHIGKIEVIKFPCV